MKIKEMLQKHKIVAGIIESVLFVADLFLMTMGLVLFGWILELLIYGFVGQPFMPQVLLKNSSWDVKTALSIVVYGGSMFFLIALFLNRENVCISERFRKWIKSGNNESK